jgi:protein-L-isoaspartate(D-aspartate) O-methyltransferase
MTTAPDSWAEARRRMVLEIEHLARSIAKKTGQREISPRVLDTLRHVPRHEFVPEEQRHNAYQNRPLPIGEGQTISQPFIVALMSDLADIGANDRVLEVGTGSGYQAAVLARLAKHVFSTEIIEPLGQHAASTLARLGIDNVTLRIGDGSEGWPEQAPFDAIVVTAAPEHLPDNLIKQLNVGGRLVIPIGADAQELLMIKKRPDGTFESSEILPVRFVPLTRG